MPLKLFLFSCLFYFYHTAKAQDRRWYNDCYSSDNYTSGSVYEQNLNLTLTSLASNASLTGFLTTTVAQNPNSTVYGLVQCRGDIPKEYCQACASTAIKEIIQQCPNRKQASIGYDYCSLRYSDRTFFSTVDSRPRSIPCNKIEAADPVVFKRQLRNLVNTLSSHAASSPTKFSTGSINSTNFLNINALAQCTRDLSDSSCSGCLQDLIRYIPLCGDPKQGGRVLSPSCNLRFEVYSFYASSPPPPPAVSAPPSANILEPNSTSHEEKKSASRAIDAFVITPVAVAAALAVTLILCGCFFWRKTKKNRVDGTPEDGDKSMESLLIGLDTLKAATRNFSDENKLGQGGFGPVYKGKLFDGHEVAVKRLSSSSGQGLEELKTEVVLVAKLLHRNLVRLLGFCLEEKEKLLVYEYLPNGSLDKILFDERKRFSLEWQRRYKIIVGIARGLLYLHEDSQLRIIHRDLKASNILLDEDMNPKISDFGLAKLFGESQTQGNTNRVAETYGYMAPEYAKYGRFSTKSDVFSYGVLLLEIVAGRKNSSFRDTLNLPSYAWHHWNNGAAMELLDPTLGDQLPRYEVLKCIHIGLLSVQEAAADRPTMSEIVMMFSNYTINYPVPSKPAFFVSRESSILDMGIQDSGTSQSDSPNSGSPQQSVNDVTITDLDAR